MSERYEVNRTGASWGTGERDTRAVAPAGIWSRTQADQTSSSPGCKVNGHPRSRERGAHLPLIDLRQVTKAYRAPAGDVYALQGINLQVVPGEFVAVVGKSGAGKSTLINMVTGIDRPTSGQVCVGPYAVHAMGEDQIAAWRSREVGVIFQFFQLLPMLTCVQNVMLPMDFANQPRSPKEQRWASCCHW